MVGIEKVLQTYDRVDGVGVKTDCQAAVDTLKFGAKPHRRGDFRVFQERLLEGLEKKSAEQGSPVKVRIRWVKGHQGKGTTQGWMNNRVDQLAVKARKS